MKFTCREPICPRPVLRDGLCHVHYSQMPASERSRVAARYLPDEDDLPDTRSNWLATEDDYLGHVDPGQPADDPDGTFQRRHEKRSILVADLNAAGHRVHTSSVRSPDSHARQGPENAPYGKLGDRSDGYDWLTRHDPLAGGMCRAGIHPKSAKGPCKLCRLARNRRYNEKKKIDHDQKRHSSMSYEDAIIALELSDSKQYGSTWQCLAHEDRRPSLSVTRGRRGNAIVYCHAGCSWREVLDGLSA
jgi:hypothetical protein